MVNPTLDYDLTRVDFKSDIKSIITVTFIFKLIRIDRN